MGNGNKIGCGGYCKGYRERFKPLRPPVSALEMMKGLILLLPEGLNPAWGGTRPITSSGHIS